MKKILFVLFFLYTTLLMPDGKIFLKYRWPLNINNGVSSSFQEFRSNHFHAGMDLRTFKKTGYPVYAISDGFIFKIRAVKRGSGRGLYLRHLDENISVYFHLDRFEKRIEDILEKVQKERKKKYVGNYFLKNPIHVNKGDLIAYSGETGYGFPHLHVEVRDKHQFALNPFQLIQFPRRDSNFPVLRSLILRNVSDSLINGKVGECSFRFERGRNNTYFIRKPLILMGTFDIVLNAYDISDTGKRMSPYKVSVFIDDTHCFNLTFDKFKRDHNNQLGFVYDMFYSNYRSFYFNLFFQKGFDIEEKQIFFNTILDKLSFGKHRINVLVEDNHHNVSSGIIHFFKVKKPELMISGITKEGDTIFLDIERLDAGSSDKVELSLIDDKGFKSYSGELEVFRIDRKRKMILKGIEDEVRFLDFTFKKDKIDYFKKRYLVKSSHLNEIEDVDYDTFINRDDVFLILKDSDWTVQDIQLEVHQGKNSKIFKPESSGDRLFFRFKPLNLNHNIKLDFIILKDGKPIREIKKKCQLIYLKQGETQQFKVDEFEAEFHTNSVREPRVLTLNEKFFQSPFPVLTKQVSLSPFHFPFLDFVYYKFKLNQSLSNPKQLGIFKYDYRKKKWKYVYTHYNPETDVFKTKVISSGTFALLRDIFPPKIRFRRSRSNLKRNLRRLVVIITDRGKGVDDTTINIWLNGHVVDSEYDPDWSHVLIEKPNLLKTGNNMLKVQVKDYAGNQSLRTYHFYLR